MSAVIAVTREGNQVRLRFRLDDDILYEVKRLPYSAYDPRTQGWTAAFSAETLMVIDQWYERELIEVSSADLLGGEAWPPGVHDGVIASGNGKFPYIVWQAWRDGPDIPKLIPGGVRLGKSQKFGYGHVAAGALMQLVDEGCLADPEGLLSSAGDATVAFDLRSGAFVSVGDERVAVSMEHFFPKKDVVAGARNFGLDVRFADTMSEELYRGELEREGPGLQPEGITAELYPYQAKAVAQLMHRKGLGLFLSPGLGKTLIGIAAGVELMARGEVGQVVITPPAAVRNQWRDEILNYTGCAEEDIVVVHGNAEKRAGQYEAAKRAPWLVVHHDLLDRDLNLVSPLVDDGTFFIIDEAHKCANPKSARGKATRQLRQAAGRGLAMTGTPVQNDPSEWYAAISELAEPWVLGSFRDFAERYMYPSEHGGYEGQRNLEELADRSRVHYIRWTKDQVATHLAPMRVEHMPLPVDKKYREALDQLHLEARDWLAAHYRNTGDDADGEDPSDMTAVGMLRAVCSSPRLLHASESGAAKALVAAGIVPDVDGPKLDTLRQMAAAMQQVSERIVVFTYSRAMAELIAERCVEDGIRHVVFHGTTTLKARDEAVRRFTTVDPSPKPGDLHANPTLFIATDAAAEGLNLDKQCSTLINFDLPWTAGRLEQRSNRIHRVNGTHSSYLVVNLTLPNTVENSILAKVEGKAAVQDVLFGEASADQVTGRRRRRRRDVLAAALQAWQP